MTLHTPSVLVRCVLYALHGMMHHATSMWHYYNAGELHQIQFSLMAQPLTVAVLLTIEGHFLAHTTKNNTPSLKAEGYFQVMQALSNRAALHACITRLSARLAVASSDHACIIFDLQLLLWTLLVAKKLLL